MSRRELILPWHAQPQEPVELNKTEWQYLNDAILPQQAKSAVGSPIQFEGSASFRAGEGGIAVGDSTKYYATFDNPTKDLVAGGSIAFLVVVRGFRQQTTNNLPICGLGSLTGSPGNTIASVAARASDGNLNILLGNASTNYSGWVNSGVSLNDYKPHVVIAQVWTSASGFSQIQEAWVDGKKFHAVSMGGNGAAIPYTQLYSRGGSRGGVDYVPNPDTDVLLSAVFTPPAKADKSLTDDQCRMLCENPWQIFEPKRIWVPVSARAGSPLTEKQGTAWSPEFASQPDVQTKKVVLDYRNPLSKHLVHAFIGGCNYDIVTGREYYGASSATPYVTSPSEVGYDEEQGYLIPANAGAGSPGNGIPGGIVPNDNEFTFIQRHKLLSTANYVTSLIGGWSSNFSRSFSIGIQFSSANFRPSIRGTTLSHPVSLKDDRWNTLGVSRGLDGIGRAWKNGVQVATASVAPFDDSVIANSQYIHFNVDGPFSLLFDRELTAVEHASVHANPYQFFKLDERYEPVAENRRGPDRRPLPFESQPQEEAELDAWVQNFDPVMVATPVRYDYAEGNFTDGEQTTEPSPGGPAWSRTAPSAARVSHLMPAPGVTSEGTFLVHGFCPQTVNNTGASSYLTMGQSSVRQEPFSGGRTIALNLYFHPDFTGSKVILASNALTSGKPFTAVFTFRRNGQIRAFVDGKLTLVDTFPDSNVSLNTLSSGLFALSSGSQRSGSMTLAAVFAKEMSIEDATRLSENPWRLFKPKTTPVARVQAPAVVVPRKSKNATDHSDISQSELIQRPLSKLFGDLVDGYIHLEGNTYKRIASEGVSHLSGTISYTATPYGIAPQSNNGGTAFQTQASGLEVTLIYYGTGAHPSVTNAVISTNNNAAFRPFNIKLGANRVIAGASLGGTERTISHLLNTLEPHLYVYAAKSGDQRLYVDGNLVAQDSVAGAGSSQLFIRLESIAAASLFAAVVRRCMPHEECATLASYDDLFDPQPQTVWAPVGRAGILLPELSNSTYKDGTLTGTGWTPQIRGRV